MRATHNTSGQTIVELIVVIGVAMVIVTALIVSSTASLRSSQYSKAKSQATKYAQEGMEVARALRDQSWDTFFSLGDTPPSEVWCLDSAEAWSPAVGGNCPVNIEGMFTRELTLVWEDTGEYTTRPHMNVTARVSWSDSGQTRGVSLTSRFTSWR